MKTTVKTMLCVLGIWACAGVAPAADYYYTWTGASNSTWELKENWTPANISPFYPAGNNDYAFFIDGGNGHTTITVNAITNGKNSALYAGINFEKPGVASYQINAASINQGTQFSQGNYANVNVAPVVLSNQTINTTYSLLNFNSSYAGLFRNHSPVATLTMSGVITMTANSTGGSNNLNIVGNGPVVIASAITDGPASKVSFSAVRAGTTTLSGANTFSGSLYGATGPMPAYNLILGQGGTLVLDYADNPAVLPSETRINSQGGTLVFRGKNTGTTTQTIGLVGLSPGQHDLIIDNNGGAGTTVTFSNTWRMSTVAASYACTPLVAFDLSSGGIARLSDTNFVFTGDSNNQFRVFNDVIEEYPLNFVATTVKGSDGKTYYGTLDAAGNIIAQNNLLPLPVSGSTLAASNCVLTANLTATGNISVNTLRIEASAAGQVLDLGGKTLTLGRRGVLLDGNYDFTITNGTNITAAIYDVLAGRKLTVGTIMTGTQSGSAYIMKMGDGLLELTGINTGCVGRTYLMAGITRISDTNALTSGFFNLGGILEVGCDFTRTPLFWLNPGFSAYGGNHFVNIGGASAVLKFGTFMTTRDSKFRLSSPLSDSTVDFQNPLDLNADFQTIEVANGSAILDAIVSGTLTNGGLIKTGAGALSLSGSNVYSNGTVIAAGTLLADNTTGSGLGFGNVTVFSGAKLGGSGTIVCATSNQVWVGGSVAPGAGVASTVAGTTLSVDLGATANSMTFAAGGSLAFKLGAAGIGDKVKFLNFGSGELTLAATPIEIQISDAGGMTTGSYTLMEFYSDNGTTLTDAGKPMSGFTLSGLSAKFATSRLDYSQTGKIILSARAQTGTLFKVW